MSVIIDPTTLLAENVESTTEAARPASLASLRVGLFENTKRNAAQLLDAIGAQLTAREPSITLVRRTKEQFGLPMSSELADDLRASCDVVIVGVGDCGSCSATAVSDGIALETRSIPTAVVITDIFEANGRAIAALEGSPEFPFIMAPHPVATLDAAQLEERARELVDRILSRLVEPALAGAHA